MESIPLGKCVLDILLQWWNGRIQLPVISQNANLIVEQGG